LRWSYMRPSVGMTLSTRTQMLPYQVTDTTNVASTSFPPSSTPPHVRDKPPSSYQIHSKTPPQLNSEGLSAAAVAASAAVAEGYAQQYAQRNSLTDTSKYHTPSHPVSSLPAPASTTPRRRREKLPKPVTDYLKDWLHCHSDHPYPSEDEKKQLCQATGLSMQQVTNWMINVCQFSFLS